MAVPIQKLYDNPTVVHSENSLAKCVAGLSSAPCPAPGPSLSPGVQGGLFPARGGPEGGLDLASINIQRGRDHGLPGYAQYRQLCSGAPVTSFTSLLAVMSEEAVGELKSVYSHVGDVDLWIGGLMERPLPGALLGPTFAWILQEQFGRSRQADRFFYSGAGGAGLTAGQVSAIERHSLARLLCDNSPVDFLQPLAMRAASQGNPPVNCWSPSIPPLDLDPWG